MPIATPPDFHAAKHPIFVSLTMPTPAEAGPRRAFAAEVLAALSSRYLEETKDDPVSRSSRDGAGRANSHRTSIPSGTFWRADSHLIVARIPSQSVRLLLASLGA